MANDQEAQAKDVWEDCLLGRRDEALKLERYIKNIHTSDRLRGHTINIDAKWGEGKTHFLNRWEQQLKKNHLVIYWDAWKTDFAKDPLLSFLSLLHNLPSTKNVVIDNAVRGLKQYIPVAVNLALKHFIDLEVEDFKVKDPDEGRKLLESYKDECQVIETLKAHLSKLVKAINGCPNIYLPVFVLIDELDRCRPDYSLLLLERIKHLFDIQGFEFIVATDTSQLSHTVKAVYGNGFDGSRYLKRFFDIQYHFQDVDAKPHANFLFNNSTIKEYLYSSPWEDSHEQIFCDISSIFELSMRDRAQIFEKLEQLAKLAFTPGSLHLVPMVYFLSMHHKFSEHYDYLSKLASVGNVTQFLENSGFPKLAKPKEKYKTRELHRDHRGHVEKSTISEVTISIIIDFYLLILDSDSGQLDVYLDRTNRQFGYEFQIQIARDIVHCLCHSPLVKVHELRKYKMFAQNLGGLSGWQGGQ